MHGFCFKEIDLDTALIGILFYLNIQEVKVVAERLGLVTFLAGSLSHGPQHAKGGF
jgi:hypothetical protein